VQTLTLRTEGTDVDRAVDAVAGYGFACGHGMPREPIEPVEWPTFLDRIVQQRMVGLLAAAIGNESFPITEPQRTAVAELDTQVAVASLILERLLLDVATRFDDDAIDFRALKGSAVAHNDYPDPSLRSFGDVDLLVRPADFGRAICTLEAMGGRRVVPELRPDFDRRFGKGAVVGMPEDLEIDLHRTFVAGALGMTIDLDGLFETARPFMLGDRKVLALATEERLLHACIHAALDQVVRRHSLRDIAQMATNDTLDADRLVTLAESWRCSAVVARAIRLTWETLDLADEVPLSIWAARYRMQPRERRVLDSYLAGDGSYTRRAISALFVIRRPRDKLAYARALLFPQQNHLDARRSGRVGHVWRGVGHLCGRTS
jgi:hypothetical protein